ncbi:MAG: hypothetical protein RLN87_12845 [Parasphingopyxis sp.]|uniref:tetratricopeptide repeat protein n=1 Tax=Parasphingopyxis sp. TaxID=1920299 RepID=UPI0032EE8956
MRMFRTAGLAASLMSGICLAMPAAAQEQAAAPSYELSRDVRQAAQQAQLAIAQNNFAAASAALNQAGAAVQNDGDRYVIATMQLDVANRTFNQAAQVAAIDALIASPMVSESERAELYYHRGRIAYNSGDNNAAQSSLQTAVQRGSTNPRTYVALASLLQQARDNAGALAAVDQAFQLQQTAAVPIPEDWYRRAIDIAQRVGDQGKVAQWYYALLAAYPTVRNWRDALRHYRTTMAADPEAVFDLWRLQAATETLTGEGDYLAFAQAANSAEHPGEATRAIEAGRGNSMLDGRNAEIAALARTTGQAASSLRGRLESRATAARSAATGAEAMAVADAYLDFGQFAEAAEFYRLAVEKGGIDAQRANLRLGIALSQAGDVATARTTLDGVTGPLGGVARYWTVFANTRPAQAPVMTPAAVSTSDNATGG